MNSKIWWVIIAILLVVIVILTWMLVATPATQAPVTATSTTASQTTPTTSEDQPLHSRVVITSPSAGATVGQTFTVTGQAPGNWYNEAVFPLQVRDADNNVIGHGQAQAQSDWMTTAQVPFSAAVSLDTVYHGAATLVILKDNESGLPENDDSLEVPIVIQ